MMFLAILKVPASGRAVILSALAGMSAGLVWAQGHWLFGLPPVGLDVGDPGLLGDHVRIGSGAVADLPGPHLGLKRKEETGMNRTLTSLFSRPRILAMLFPMLCWSLHSEVLDVGSRLELFVEPSLVEELRGEARLRLQPPDSPGSGPGDRSSVGGECLLHFHYLPG